MNIKDNFFELWNTEICGHFSKSIEDNQLISLPMISSLDGEKYIFAFVISICNDINEVQVLQKHFWNFNDHHLILDRNKYVIKHQDISILYNKDFLRDYYRDLAGIIDFSFNDKITKDEKLKLMQYMRLLQRTGTLQKVHINEDKVFRKWILKILVDN